MSGGGIVSGYQLIRGVLAAYATGGSFCVFCDARRPDLIENWYSVMRAVRSCVLRCRLQLLTWQELATGVAQFTAEISGSEIRHRARINKTLARLLFLARAVAQPSDCPAEYVAGGTLPGLPIDITRELPIPKSLADSDLPSYLPKTVFKTSVLQDKRLHRSARFRYGQSLPSTAGKT